ncbi:sugar phosphate isomerase/epimerase family protein [Derxia gummosa]|uniref:Sugar phosphate isomerase/epimerase family protein n=1 Tax=Derxia gummosa DSM 723 TaxID=1121388 RepID=A0A8B6X2K4_9BURK|nr:sugar phosphate isomerase/epimerase [Derxia gummosa]
MQIPLSLAALTVLELDPAAMIRCAADAGYPFIGLRLVPATPTEPHWDTVGNTPTVRDMKRALAETGVQCGDIEILRLKPDTKVADFEPIFATAAELGARFALIAGNDPDESRLTANLAATCELARGYGIRPHLEPMPWTDCKDFVQGLRIVEATGMPEAGLLIDPIHFDRAGNTADQIALASPARFGYVQFCDAPAKRPDTVEELLFQARAERLPPGEGGLDLVGILRAVGEAPGALSVEIPQTELAKTVGALERAKRLRAAAERMLAGIDLKAAA